MEYETRDLEFQPKVGVIARSIELGENDVAIPGSLHHAPGVIRDDNLALFLDLGCWILDRFLLKYEISSVRLIVEQIQLVTVWQVWGLLECGRN